MGGGEGRGGGWEGRRVATSPPKVNAKHCNPKTLPKLKPYSFKALQAQTRSRKPKTHKTVSPKHSHAKALTNLTTTPFTRCNPKTKLTKANGTFVYGRLWTARVDKMLCWWLPEVSKSKPGEPQTSEQILPLLVEAVTKPATSSSTVPSNKFRVVRSLQTALPPRRKKTQRVVFQKK